MAPKRRSYYEATTHLKADLVMRQHERMHRQGVAPRRLLRHLERDGQGYNPILDVPAGHGARHPDRVVNTGEQGLSCVRAGTRRAPRAVSIGRESACSRNRDDGLSGLSPKSRRTAASRLAKVDLTHSVYGCETLSAAARPVRGSLTPETVRICGPKPAFSSHAGCTYESSR